MRFCPYCPPNGPLPVRLIRWMIKFCKYGTIPYGTVSRSMFVTTPRTEVLEI